MLWLIFWMFLVLGVVGLLTSYTFQIVVISALVVLGIPRIRRYQVD
jgi:hypothetical protein